MKPEANKNPFQVMQSARCIASKFMVKNPIERLGEFPEERPMKGMTYIVVAVRDEYIMLHEFPEIWYEYRGFEMCGNWMEKVVNITYETRVINI